MQPPDAMADRFAHPAHLAVAAFVEDELEAGRTEPANARGRRETVLELDALGERAQGLVVRLPPGLHLVDLLDAVPGVGERVRELAVVREQQRARRVDVEPADGDDARVVLDEPDHGRPALRVAGGRHDARRLVQEHVGEPLLATPGCPSTSTASSDWTKVFSRPGSPLTSTRPALISSSAFRREATPERYYAFNLIALHGCLRPRSGRLQGSCAFRIRASGFGTCAAYGPSPLMRDRSQDVDRLADLLVGFGANIQPGQILGVTAYHGMEETAYAARAGYKRGAKYVDVFWWDHLVKRQRLEHADESTLDFVPPWIEQRMQWLSDEHAARVSLAGTSVAVFDGLDPARTGRDLLPYIAAVPRIVNERTTNWCAGPSPNVGWAQRALRARARGGAREALGRDRVRSGSTAMTRSRRGVSG